jgi:hypothetical protein
MALLRGKNYFLEIDHRSYCESSNQEFYAELKNVNILYLSDKILLKMLKLKNKKFYKVFTFETVI